MDNLAHTLAATALVKTRIGRRSPLSAVALVVAANLPDLDIVSGLWEPPAYLVHHRGITHSLLGIAAQAVALSLLFGWIERYRARRRAEPNLPSAWGTFPAAIVGLLSHFFLDALNTYGVRPWLPFSNEWVYGDLAFIVDPYLWILFATMTFASRPHAPTGHVAFAVFVLGTGYFVLTHPRSPESLKIIYPAALAALTLLRWRGIPEFASKVWIAGGCAVFALYLGTLSWMRQLAASELVPAPLVMSVHPAQPWRWTAVQAFENEIVWHELELGRPPALPRRVPRQLDREEVQQAMQTELGRAWLQFARVPFASVEGELDAEIVHLMDARYQRTSPAGWSGMRMPVRR